MQASERTIGNYKIIAQLGEGGMGVVYLGEHLALGRKAAIKVLREQMAADPEVVSRFFNEARASTAIRHPNIVEIYDYGTLADGSTYIVMEYLEGQSLAERLRSGRLSIATAVSFVWQAAAALAAAHDKGIVHRDLKPENVFVTPDARVPGEEQIKILDFGVAKLGSEIDAFVSHKTRTGALLGTPLYMSPEQCLGIREIDYRTDIYSLGCIFFEMLCGSPPFFSEGFGALLNMHINQPPEAPSRRNPNVPEGIDAAVLRMLAKDAGARFTTMTELQEAMAPFLSLADVSGPMRSRLTSRSGSVPVRRAPSLLMKTTLSSSMSSPSRASSTASGGDGVVTTLAAAPTPPDGPRHRLSARAIALGAGGLVIAGVILWALGRPAPRRSPPVATTGAAPPVTATVARVATAAGGATAASVVTAGAATAPPASGEVDIAVASEPPGAQVTVDGRPIGTTPTSFRTALPSRGAAGRASPTLTFAFALDGYRREVIEAVAEPGLRIAAVMKRLPGRRPVRPTAVEPANAAPDAAAPAPPDDIKLER